MTSHIAVLPEDVLQLLCLNDGDTNAPNAENYPFLRLPHPRTRMPCLFFPCRRNPGVCTTILEVQATAPPEERSWIDGEDVVAGKYFPDFLVLVITLCPDGRMLVMTPIDPVFLLYPILNNGQESSQFRTLEDIVDQTLGSTKESIEDVSGKQRISSAVRREDISRFLGLDCIPGALSRLCESKQITPEITVYRYDSTKFMEYLRLKVNHLCQTNAFASSKTTTRSLAKEGLMEDGKERLLKVAQTRAACEMISQYLSADAKSAFFALFDFAELDKYISFNKQEAVTIATSAVVAKKGKGVEEPKQAAGDKRKKGAKSSVGVEKLKKVNTTGMPKLSSFFNKKAT